ncbi:flavin reductase [Phanerochaete sordida]|uniref:Flavin reductase n=1 Tax=Phanerochaete sordida TaxID=48140 RepID=A0A9P3LFF0_9APHY|nr:flavin reductase [Phanerochaete sordida]
MLTRAAFRASLGGLARRSLATKSADDVVRRDLRALLRETAQPVAVVTALMPTEHQEHPASPSACPSAEHTRFHGATLSSFSSIALDPVPLVAFSLRIPSRMATSLKACVHGRMVVNVLAAPQAALAVRFSRPDLHAHPFDGVGYRLSAEGLPVLDGALGALSCALVARPWPLHDLGSLGKGMHPGDAEWEGEGVASELFIARVTRVERVPEDTTQSPLLYHRRSYATTAAIPSDGPPKPRS